jgi:hypothetical protein
MAAAQANAAAPLPGDAVGSQGDVHGIAAGRPVFAGTCKACPWGMLTSVTKEALTPYGCDVKIEALDKHRDIFRLQAEPWHHDAKMVAASATISMHPGTMQYCRERGYVQ